MDIRTKIVIDGVAWGLAIFAILILIFAIVKPDPPQGERFKVVDKYEGCDVVRYTDASNTWHYLLRCSK